MIITTLFTIILTFCSTTAFSMDRSEDPLPFNCTEQQLLEMLSKFAEQNPQPVNQPSLTVPQPSAQGPQITQNSPMIPPNQPITLEYLKVLYQTSLYCRTLALEYDTLFRRAAVSFLASNHIAAQKQRLNNARSIANKKLARVAEDRTKQGIDYFPQSKRQKKKPTSQPPAPNPEPHSGPTSINPRDLEDVLSLDQADIYKPF